MALGMQCLRWCFVECLEEWGLDGSLVMGCVWSLTMLVVIRMGRKRKMGKVIERRVKRDFLVVQWPRYHIPNAGSPGLILGQGTNPTYCNYDTA